MKSGNTGPAVCGIMLLAALLGSGCASVDLSKFPDPHGHKIAVHEENSWSDRMKDLKKSEGVLPLMKPATEDAVFNPSHTLSATIGRTHHQFYGYAVPVVVLLRNGRPYATFVSGSWPNRPMDGIAWLNDRLVCFDLYAGEDMGWHYVIDAEESRAVFAAPFSER